MTGDTRSQPIVERLRRGATHGVLIPCEDLIEAADRIEKLEARVVALEQVISEEIYPENCDDDANRMLLESAIDSHNRRLAARQPEKTP